MTQLTVTEDLARQARQADLLRPEALVESGMQSVGAVELHVIGKACGSTGPELLARAVQAAEK